jgi:hypothetical protein
MLQTGRSRVRFPMVSLEFFSDIILPVALWPCGRLSLWQKWVPGAFRGGKGGRCVRLTTLPPSYAVVMKSGNLNFLEPSGPLQPCNGTALHFNLHNDQYKFFITSLSVLLIMRNVSDKSCREIQNTHLLFNDFFPKFVPLWDNVAKFVEPSRPQITIRRMRIACWIPKATNTHSEHVILTACPLQQKLHRRALKLHYTYIDCIVKPRRPVFTARYELNLYTCFRLTSISRGLNSHQYQF